MIAKKNIGQGSRVGSEDITNYPGRQLYAKETIPKGSKCKIVGDFYLVVDRETSEFRPEYDVK